MKILTTLMHIKSKRITKYSFIPFTGVIVIKTKSLDTQEII